MATKKNYETGMKITYDQKAKTAMVAFRGRVTVLPGPYTTEGEAVNAGEKHCKANGWDENAGAGDPKSMLTKNRSW